MIGYLQGITIVWMFVECAVALIAAERAHSSVLLAFGSDSVIELLSATVVLLQFSKGVRLNANRASRIAGMLLLALAGVVVVTSIASLVFASGTETQPFRHQHHRRRTHRHASPECCEEPFRSCHGKRRLGGRFYAIGNLRISCCHYPGGIGRERALPSSVGGFGRSARSYANSLCGGQTRTPRRGVWLLLGLVSHLCRSLRKTAVQQIQFSFQPALTLFVNQVLISQLHGRQSFDAP